MSNPPTARAVDRFAAAALLAEDKALEGALERTRLSGLPDIQVSSLQGRMLTLLAKSINAERILEVGTLAGYSAICLARALPEQGKLVTLEIDYKHASVARENIKEAGLEERIEVILAPAAQTLESLREKRSPPFDFTFIDADKESNLIYFEHALALSRPGSLIIVDNVVRSGDIANATSTDPRVKATRELIDTVGKNPHVEATVIQTVGDKGHDGFLLARVNEEATSQ